jgi:hemolysin III
MYVGERFNSISHLIGAAAALAGTIILIVLAARDGDPWKLVSFSVYGTTLVALYTFSTLYHSLRGEAKRIFRRLDHQTIYLLIAGTYTPFTLVTLRGEWGWTLFGIVWALAVTGIIIDSWPSRGRRILPVIVYLVMGWLVVTATGPLLKALPPAGITGLVMGGLFYTGGVVFYALDKVRHFHGVWHLFVLAGSVSHYFTILLYVN